MSFSKYSSISDQQLNIKLVEEIEKCPVLYNYTLPDYSRKDVTEEAWNRVANAVNMDVFACKEKWKNIRAVFSRHMKNPKTGAGFARRKYYLWDAMQYTIPYFRNTPKAPNPAQHDNDELIRLNIVKSETSSPLPSSRECTPSPSPPPREPNTTTEMLNITPYKRALSNDAEDNAFVESLHFKKTKPSSSDQADQDAKTEGLKMFLLSMLPDLLNMSDEQVRRFKRNALEVIDDILSSDDQKYVPWGNQ